MKHYKPTTRPERRAQIARRRPYRISGRPREIKVSLDQTRADKLNRFCIKHDLHYSAAIRMLLDGVTI